MQRITHRARQSAQFLDADRAGHHPDSGRPHPRYGAPPRHRRQHPRVRRHQVVPHPRDQRPRRGLNGIASGCGQ